MSRTNDAAFTTCLSKILLKSFASDRPRSGAKMHNLHGACDLDQLQISAKHAALCPVTRLSSVRAFSGMPGLGAGWPLSLLACHFVFKSASPCRQQGEGVREEIARLQSRCFGGPAAVCILEPFSYPFGGGVGPHCTWALTSCRFRRRR